MIVFFLSKKKKALHVVGCSMNIKNLPWGGAWQWQNGWLSGHSLSHNSQTLKSKLLKLFHAIAFYFLQCFHLSWPLICFCWVDKNTSKLAKGLESLLCLSMNIYRKIFGSQRHFWKCWNVMLYTEFSLFIF